MAVTGTVGARQIEENSKIVEAISDLRANSLDFAVVVSLRNEILGILSIAQLEKATPDKQVKTLVASAQTPIIVDSQESLEDVVKKHSKDLELRPNLGGVIVTSEQQISGVLPRSLIINQARRVVTRGSGIARIEGSPLDTLFFRCEIDNERKMISYYDPADPPRCSNNHKMVPEE
jgi:hypothetical protein